MLFHPVGTRLNIEGRNQLTWKNETGRKMKNHKPNGNLWGENWAGNVIEFEWSERNRELSKKLDFGTAL